MSNLTVTTTSNGTVSTISPTAYNPYTGLPATINTYQWYYYLVNGSSLTQTITVQTDSTQLIALYFCLIGPGGQGGMYAASRDVGSGGGGASGTVLLLNYTNYSVNLDQTFTVSLPAIGSGVNSTLWNPAISGGTTYNAYPGLPGNNGGNPTSNSAGNGGNGGNGGHGNEQNSHNACPSVEYNGGGGGNGGSGGSGTYDINTGQYSTDGSHGSPGDSYHKASAAGVGASDGASYCPVSFADGQTANINSGGLQNCSGPVSSVMIYYYQ